jgi:hypothetical protein
MESCRYGLDEPHHPDIDQLTSVEHTMTRRQQQQRVGGDPNGAILRVSYLLPASHCSHNFMGGEASPVFSHVLDSMCRSQWTEV